MNKLLGILAIVAFSAAMLPLGLARPEYAKKEGKKCTDCHVNGNPKQLTDMGKYYKEHNHSLKGYKAPQKQS
jgi:hypothetical protein